MDLLVVRHAVAEDRASFARTGKDDAERPLTKAGRRKFERCARGLLRLVPSIDLLTTSALVRAVETAQLIQDVYRIEGAARLDELDPEAEPAALLRWLRRHRRQGTIASVGHEPHLSGFVEYAITGARAGFLDLRKGGACLLDLGDDPQPGRGRLRWLLTPRQLRRLR